MTDKPPRSFIAQRLVGWMFYRMPDSKDEKMCPVAFYRDPDGNWKSERRGDAARRVAEFVAQMETDLKLPKP